MAPSPGGKDAQAGPSKGDSTPAGKEAAKLENERKRLEKETEREKQRLEKERAKAAKDRQKAEREAEREAKRAEKEREKAAKEVLNPLALLHHVRGEQAMEIVWYASSMLQQTSIDEGRGVAGHVEHSHKSMDVLFLRAGHQDGVQVEGGSGQVAQLHERARSSISHSA